MKFNDLIKKIDINKHQQQLNTDNIKVIINTFPFDEGTNINGGRVGGERGPATFRFTLKTTPLYPDQAIENIGIYDSGDIVSNSLLDSPTPLPEAHKILEEKNTKILKTFQNSLLFIVGGSNDQSYPNAKSLLNAYPNSRIAVINIDAHFDVRPLKEGKAHSGSPFRLLIEDPDFIKTNGILVEFASQGAQCSKHHYDYIVEKGFKVYWLSHIRRHKLCEDNSFECKTQAGQLMEKILNELSSQVEHIFFSFDIDSINSSYCPGVSAPSVIGGLTDEEALELAYIAGKTNKVKLMDISEFNPAVESKRTSTLIVNILYKFIKGISSRIYSV